MIRKKISDEKIEVVKSRLKTAKSLRAVAMVTGVSYYTVWHISKGSYDNAGQFPNLASKFKRQYSIDQIRHF